LRLVSAQGIKSGDLSPEIADPNQITKKSQQASGEVARNAGEAKQKDEPPVAAIGKIIPGSASRDPGTFAKPDCKKGDVALLRSTIEKLLVEPACLIQDSSQIRGQPLGRLARISPFKEGRGGNSKVMMAIPDCYTSDVLPKGGSDSAC